MEATFDLAKEGGATHANGAEIDAEDEAA